MALVVLCVCTVKHGIFLVQVQLLHSWTHLFDGFGRWPWAVRIVHIISACCLIISSLVCHSPGHASIRFSDYMVYLEVVEALS